MQIICPHTAGESGCVSSCNTDVDADSTFIIGFPLKPLNYRRNIRASYMFELKGNLGCF